MIPIRVCVLAIVVLCVLVLPGVIHGAPDVGFNGYIYPTPTPTSSFVGYDYPTPACPLPAPPITVQVPKSCMASATIVTVPVKVNVTETIVTFLKVPTTVTTTLIVPTTSTEVHRAVETSTDYHTTTHTQHVTLPAVTRTSLLTSTIARIETITSPVVRVEYITERYPVVEYRTDTITQTSTCTVTELLPTTYVSTYISTSYPPPVTDTSFRTETAYRTITETAISTLIRIKTDTSPVYRTRTDTITATKTQREVTTVSVPCAPPPLNNEYLPIPEPSNDYLPPSQQQQAAAEQRLRSNFVLPEDLLLPPKLQVAPAKETVQITVTKTLDPVTLTTTREHTITKRVESPADTRHRYDLGGGGGAGAWNSAPVPAAVRTKSVIALDQRITKLVTVTPTLTSYIYMDTVTVTSTRPSG
uniref:Putative conserved secreted protein n=1 Tax=Anopheles darlingi TaxID=43151 RepID=A0A2M4D1Q1_ANODA